MAFFALLYPFDHRGKTMTMIPLSSFATSSLHQTSPPWGHCIRISRRPFREPRGPYHLVTACSLGLLQLTPRAPSCQIERRLVFFRAAPVFGPLLSCGVRPCKIKDLAREPDHRGTGQGQSRTSGSLVTPCANVGVNFSEFPLCKIKLTKTWTPHPAPCHFS